MEYLKNSSTLMRIKSQRKSFHLKTFLQDTYQYIADNKANFFFMLLFLMMPLFYELLSFISEFTERNDYLEATKQYFVFNDYVTVFAQKTFGTTQSIIGIFSAYFYTYGLIILSFTAFLMLIIFVFMRKKQYRRREPYVYIPIIIIMEIIGILAYFIIPTAPPGRVFPSLLYRTIIVPIGDSLISIKYNSLPSGHIYALAVPFLVAKAENYKNWKNFFGGSLVLTSWIILLTGDHYPIDIFSSYFLCFLLFTIFTTIYDYYNPNTVRVSRKVFINRIKNTLFILMGLVILSLLTITYINPLFFIIQAFCILVIWPIIVFSTNTDGLLNNNKMINRSLFSDLKDFFLLIKGKVLITNSSKTQTS